GRACCIGHKAGTLCRSNQFARLNSPAPCGVAVSSFAPGRGADQTHAFLLRPVAPRPRGRREERRVAMTGWVILVDQARDFPNADTPHKVITTSDYLARPKLFAGAGRAKLINLSRSYNYQSKGYYASLLAEARGHRVIRSEERRV